MKINVRLLLINFIIVLVVTLTSTLVYYSVSSSFFNTQNSKIILSAANDFVFSFQTEISKIDDSFNSFINRSKKSQNIFSTPPEKIGFDFVFQVKKDSIIEKGSFHSFNKVSLNYKSSTAEDFFVNNPNVILRSLKIGKDTKYYFGKIINREFVTKLEKQIDAKISFIADNIPFVLPGDTGKNPYLYQITKAINYLKYKNNYDLFIERLESSDFFATYYFPKQNFAPGNKKGFLIYITPVEGVEYASKMQMMMVIIIFAGLSLSVVLVLLFTGKFRKQIFILSETAKETSKGNLEKRIPIITKDEIGQFAESFNGMLDELARKSNEEKEYSEFLSLLNQNPELIEISETSLSNILRACHLTVGAFYLLQNDVLRCITYKGVDNIFTNSVEENDIYKEVIKKKELVEYHFSENFPTIKSGLTEIKLKYMLIFPILFNKEVIAIIELASQTEPEIDIKSYLKRIQNQLAIGLVNAKSLDQLENLVAELRKLNDEYQKQNEQIKSKNEELLSLHNKLKHQADELETQKDKAVSLTKVKSQFLASMSHELRTPLNSILGLTELVVHDVSTSSKTKERLNIVVRNSNKLLSLINNILEFSKMDSGKIEVIASEFLLSDFLLELKSFINPLAEEKEIELIIEGLSNSDVLLFTDKNKLDQILTNLLSNAVKFTNKGSIKLKIEESENSGLNFSVSDTGIGIDEKEIERIFEEFLQVEAGNSRKYGGTGLGLAICKRYSELLNGELFVSSKLNSGSIFTVALPGIVKEKWQTEKSQITTQHTIEHKKGMSFSSILIITSTKEIQKIFKDYFSNYDVNVAFADSLTNGYQIANKLHPDYIILDLFLEENLGIELLIKLKGNSQTSDIQLILTAFNTTDKLGFGFPINNFLLHSNNNSKLDSLIKKLEGNSNESIKDIVVINSTPQSIVTNKKYSVKEFSPNDFNLLLSLFKEKEPDLIIFHLDNSYQNELSILFELQKDNYLQNIPVIFYFPDKLDEGIHNSIISDAKIIINKGRYHRYDVLKIIRNRLNLLGQSQSEKKLLLDDYENSGIEKNNTKTHFQTPKEITVLIVDDDEDTLFTVGEIVRDIGFNTEFAHDGVECLVAINSNLPDIVLLDIMMPNMDGFETIKKIRSNNNTETLPVFALTAYAMLDDKEIIEKNGFDGLITKPINRAELAFKVKRIFNLDSERAL